VERSWVWDPIRDPIGKLSPSFGPVAIVALFLAPTSMSQTLRVLSQCEKHRATRPSKASHRFLPDNGPPSGERRRPELL
jgi:hypothetical protein